MKKLVATLICVSFVFTLMYSQTNKDSLCLFNHLNQFDSLGNRAGQWISLDDNGRIKNIVEYQNNQRAGFSIEYNEDGFLKISYFINDTLNGYSQLIVTGGIPWYRILYKDGKRNGPMINYFPITDTLTIEGITYYTDDKVISHKSFNERGFLLGESQVSGDTTYYIEYKPNGNYWKHFSFQGQTSDWYEYNSEGDLITRIFYFEGKKVKTEHYDKGVH